MNELVHLVSRLHHGMNIHDRHITVVLG